VTGSLRDERSEDVTRDGARTAPLPRLGRGGLSRLAGDTLLSRIVRGIWKPGDRLPSERQLSAELGMSRPSVREAIRGLEAMGLVDVRHGQGVYVREAGEAADDAFFAGWQVDHSYAIGELLAFRLLIEPQLAALAAEHADARFVDELAGIMAAMEAAAEVGDLNVLVQMDTSFHDAITRRAGNRLYRDLLDHIAGLSIDSRRISLSVPGRAVQVIASHTGVVDAIAAGDPEGASLAMAAHLEKFASDMHIRPVGRFAKANT
jgi:GntR family transcriptional repressor for pyruvate dehydrogenase complex